MSGVMHGNQSPFRACPRGSFRNHGILKRTYIRPLSRLMW